MATKQPEGHMPANFIISVSEGMVYSEATGVVSRGDAFGQQEQLLHHPDFRPEFNQLLDLRHATELDLTSDDIEQLATSTVFGLHSKQAIVVSSDFQFGMGRMFGSFQEAHGELGAVCFREMSEARTWLKLSTSG